MQISVDISWDFVDSNDLITIILFCFTAQLFISGEEMLSFLEPRNTQQHQSHVN